MENMMPTNSPCPAVKENIYAMAHTAIQKWNDMIYDPSTALNRGTLFCELDLPFVGTEVK